MSLNASKGRGDPLVGQLLAGRYRVEQLVGKGGSGVIYRATHVGLGKPAALKVLSAAWSTDASAIERFQREARAASQVGHRNIIDVYDMGTLDDGRPWLVMQWLGGRELGDLLEERGTIEPRVAATIMRQAGSALDAVHGKGIVHRDIKPENFFLHTEEDGREIVKLLDFGLAAIRRPGDEAKRLTRHGVIHGTPHYMAPEATEQELPDHRADVYSLAVVGFEMLTGELPFDSDNPVQILTMKVAHAAPSMRDKTGVRFPADLEEIVARGLQRDPKQRTQTAGEFATAFATAIENSRFSGVHPRPLGTIPADVSQRIATTLAMESPRRKRLRSFAIIGAVALASAVLAFLLSSGMGEDGAAPPEPATPAEAVEPPTPSPTLVRMPLPEPDPLIPLPAPVDRSRSDGDDPRPRQRQISKTTAMRAPAEEPAAPRSGPERSAELRQQATHALVQGRASDAIRLFREATAAHPGNAAAWRGLGLAHERLGQRPEAIEAYERYLGIAPDAQDAAQVRERIAQLAGG